MTKPTLHLNLEKRWYDMIESGEKTEEYRVVKQHWIRIFSNGIKIKGKYYHPTDVLICFSNGYQKNRRQMLVQCLGVRTRRGKPEWGALPGQHYYVLLLGRIIEKNHS